MTSSRSGPRKHLSKSRVMSGLQCTKRLWLEVYSPELKAELTAAQERVFAVGTAVGEIARKEFPGGTLVEAPFYDLPGGVRETAALLGKSGIPHIYEAAFEADSTHVKVDVLSRLPDGSWHLIEVKSTTRVKDEHVMDAAVQWHVAEEAGIQVSRCSLMHLNKECRFPDLTNLFVVDDISERARSKRAQVPGIIDQMKALVASNSEPDVRIGTHCTKPYECPFKSHCWRHVPAQSIFTIPRLSGDVKDSLVAGGVLKAIDVPYTELNDAQATHVQMLRDGRPVIDAPAIRSALGALEYPLYFLDFETCADAIPHFDGLGPWQNYPFQYSLHVLTRDGTLTHSDYLHETPSDPRAPLARALCRDIGATGTLVAYNAGFEQRVIKDLAERSPDQAEALLAMIPRFFDLLVIFRRHYAHPEFGGSNSIKHVLPVLVPDLSYNGMAVANGEDAQAVWSKVITLPAEDDLFGGVTRQAFVADLLKYCELDTLAMVKIYEVLLKL